MTFARSSRSPRLTNILALLMFATGGIHTSHTWATEAGAVNSRAANTWQFTLGAGVVTRPEYAGSGDNKTQAVPMFSATYGNYFIGGTPGTGQPMGVGMHLVKNKQWNLGFALGGDLSKPREESDADRLRGLGDIAGTAKASVFASYTLDRFMLRGNVVTDIGGKNRGTQASLDLEARFMPMEGLMLTAGPGMTWADKDYTRTFFGVTAEQSLRSGLPVYDGKSGIHSARFSLGANYRLTQNWNLGARFTASKLRNDAADSPITVDKTQNSMGLFVFYRF